MKKNTNEKRTLRIIIVSILLVLIAAIVALIVLSSEEAQRETLTPAMAEIEAPAESEAEPTPPTEAEENDTEERFIDPNIDPTYYMVINRTYPIPESYIAGTGELREIEGKQMETNACIALEQMVAALRSEGMDIIVWSGYRTDADQEYLYQRQIGRQNGDEVKAATISAVPLTSEHQAGLAIDLSIDGSLTEDFAATSQGQWLKAHCAEYGYILRYPPGKSQFTGIISEPWHFRYVGSAEQAKAIMASGLCMEEYFEQYLATEDIEPYLPYLEQTP